MRAFRQPWMMSVAAAAAAALLFATCHGAPPPMQAAQPPSMPTFGSASAYVDPTKSLQNLTVAAIESGQATATGTPLAVQQAFLKNVLGNATTSGHQTVRSGASRRCLGSDIPTGIGNTFLLMYRLGTESGLGRQIVCRPATLRLRQSPSSTRRGSCHNARSRLRSALRGTPAHPTSFQLSSTSSIRIGARRCPATGVSQPLSPEQELPLVLSCNFETPLAALPGARPACLCLGKPQSSTQPTGQW